MSNEPVTKVRPMRADASGTAREKAYIIDDDPLMAELLERRLERDIMLRRAAASPSRPASISVSAFGGALGCT